MDAPQETQQEYDDATSTSGGGVDIETFKTILLGLLGAVLLFLLIFLAINTSPRLVNCYRKLTTDDKKHIAKRTQTIRTWTISKPVIDHERQCRHSKANNKTHEHETRVEEYPCSDESASCSSLESTQVQSCGICFEPFRVKDIVSLASTSDCHHAFHPNCIEKWLLRHDDCPICRRKYLLVDYTRQTIPSQTLKALANERKKRHKCTFFSVRDGLIVQMEESSGARNGNMSVCSSTENLSMDLDTSCSTTDNVDDVNKSNGDLPFRRSAHNSSDSSLQAPHRPKFIISMGDDNTGLDNSNQWVIFKAESSETAFTVDSSASSQV